MAAHNEVHSSSHKQSALVVGIRIPRTKEEMVEFQKRAVDVE